MPVVYVFGRCEEVTVGSLSWQSPATPAVDFGTTTATITWETPTGGLTPYVYSETVLSYDSSDLYEAGISDTGLVTELTGLTDGTAYIFQRSVTDAAGNVAIAQATIVVVPGLATITAGAAPISHVIVPADQTSAEIGYWEEATGGVGPYTYTLAELTGYGTSIYGSGLGFYYVTGLTNGISLIYLMTIEDSLGAKAYSSVTMTVETNPSEWVVLKEIDFTDADWTSFSSTDATVSTVARQHRIYGADGTTPKIDIWNTDSDGRSLSIEPNGDGLVLSTTNATAQSGIKVLILDDDGFNIFGTSFNWGNDVVKVEFLAEAIENSGTAGFSKLIAFSWRSWNYGPQHGYRITHSGTGIRPNRRGFTGATSDLAASYETVIADSGDRRLSLQWEGYITGDRILESYGRAGLSITDHTPIPRSGIYWMHPSVSQSMTKIPTTTGFGSFSGTQGGWGIMMYNDGSVIDDGVTNLSRFVLKKVRISRFPNGAKL